MSRRVLLLTPPYHAGVVESVGRWPPLNLLYLAGALEDAGHQVEVYDAMTEEHDLDQIREHVARARPDMVGVGAYTCSYPAALATLRVAKDVLPEVVTFMGGVHPTFCYRDVLQDYSDVVDCVIRGEGEETVREMVDALPSLAQGGAEAIHYGSLAGIRGLAFKRNGHVEVTEPRPFMADLDAIQPAWHLIPWETYSLYFIPGSRVATVSSSRGCVNECAFCSQQKFWSRTHRVRRPERFLAEIDLLYRRYGVNTFLLSDEYPTKDRERWEAILDGLIERDYPIRILMETCATDIVRDADLMSKYKRAGVLHIYVGVEATKQDRLDSFKKNLKCAEAKEALRLINEAGMISESSFLLGVPEETPESIKETLRLAQYYNLDYAHFLMLTPWPYADSYPDLLPYIEEWDLSRYNLVEPVIKPLAMTRPELVASVLDCYRQYYLGKLEEWLAIEDGFRKDYLLRSTWEMLRRSFLKKHLGHLGALPARLRDVLERLDGRGLEGVDGVLARATPSKPLDREGSGTGL